MEFDFYKYQGAGNDFVFLDNFSGKYDDLTLTQIERLCDRRFGIGGDGLIKIDKSADWDFNMDYYNSDGSKSFCGNGARCSVRFVNDHLLKKDSYTFNAIDGIHKGQLLGTNISIDMHNIDEIEKIDENTFVLNTGSPHYIKFLDKVEQLDIAAFGQKIRFNDRFEMEGINVNAVQILGDNELFIRTYERGVEDETLACGTGISAAAIAFAEKQNREGDAKIQVKAMGGKLAVTFHGQGYGSYKSIKLIGPAEFVYKGTIDV